VASGDLGGETSVLVEDEDVMPVLVRELSNAWRRSGEPSYDSASGDGAVPVGWTAAAAGRRIRTGDRRRGSPPGLPSLGAAARVEVAAVALHRPASFSSGLPQQPP
jgi:hypothetical protein